MSERLELPEGVHVQALPARTPELQPAEHLWPLVREALANEGFASLGDLEERISQRCQTLGSDQATLQITPIPIAQLWSASKQFAALQLDADSQSFIFECGTITKDEREQEFVVVFRRSFFVPFDDNPGVFFQLCFEAGLCYAPDPAFEPWSVWFQIEVEADLAQAADRFIHRVEELHDLWQLVTERRPTSVYLFQ